MVLQGQGVGAVKVAQAIPSRLEEVRDIFLQTEDFANRNGLQQAVRFAQELQTDFTSVAFEALAKYAAEKDFHSNDTLSLWKDVQREFQEHDVQVHIGLGWALAAHPEHYTNSIWQIDTWMQPRVLDGIGYALTTAQFKLRVLMKKEPDFIEAAHRSFFDQGLGRRLWYHCLGKPEQIAQLTGAFPETRQKAIWRGTGIAAAYVGGLDENTYNRLIEFSTHKNDLKTGMALAIDSRVKARSIIGSTFELTQLIFNRTPEELHLKLRKLQLNSRDFNDWLLKIENTLSFK
ncbi:MAG: DUF1702 family protein [Chitinophagales bacterium]